MVFTLLLPAVGAGALLAVIETVLVLTTRWELFLSAREMVRFWGVVTCVAISLQLLFSSMAAALAQLLARSFREHYVLGVALVTGMCTAPAAGWLFWTLTAGRRVRDWNHRPLAVSAAVLFTSLAFMAFAAGLQRVASARPTTRHWLFWFLLLTAAVCLVVDVTVLYRLYPAFHWALAVLAVILTGAAGKIWPFAPAASRRAAQLAGALGLVAGLLGPFLLRSTADAPNLRYAIEQSAPLTGKLLRLFHVPPKLPVTRVAAARTAPPKPQSQGISLRGDDILLITIDALRADRLRSYGAHHDLTPVLDQLASSSALFEHAYTPTPHTSYAIGSLMTGKYLRPVLSLPAASREHTTLARILRRFGYRTAGFYPPAVFFVDEERFGTLAQDHFGFEYVKEMFAPAPDRVTQLQTYLASVDTGHPLFVWVHLFEPHEPYEPPPEFARGSEPEQRYDGEVAAADAAVGDLIKTFRAQRPRATVIVTADHGEEFGEHGGHHHGTTLFEEQVHVPLIWSSPGRVQPRRIAAPAQLVDIAPTLLSALGIPRDPRMRGADLSAVLNGAPPDPQLRAFASIEELRMWCDGQHKLVCEAAEGACRLYDLKKDPAESRDFSAQEPKLAQRMATELSQLVASIPEAEVLAMQSGDAWPKALALARLGDPTAREQLPNLLGDARPAVRSEALRGIARLHVSDAMDVVSTLAAQDSDADVRREAALTALALGASTWTDKVAELIKRADPNDAGQRDFARRAALTLVNASASVAPMTQQTLIGLASDHTANFSERERALLALGRAHALRSAPALAPLLDDVRLRPTVARALGELGGPVAIKALLNALAEERYPEARAAEVEALVSLKVRKVQPLLFRFLGTETGVPGGLEQWSRLGQTARAPFAQLWDLRKNIVQPVLRGHWTCRATPDANGPAGCRPGGEKSELSAAPKLARDGKARVVFAATAANSGDWLRLGEQDFDLHRGRNEVSLAVVAAKNGRVQLPVRTNGHVVLELVGVVRAAPDIPPPAPEPYDDSDSGSPPSAAMAQPEH
jgi:arylsulfatase A-like enzyme